VTDPAAPPIAPTLHSFSAADARRLDFLADASVDLVVTSPPYPMIAMWDEVFRAADPTAGAALAAGDGPAAFARMHAGLAPCWDELLRVTRPGGFICVNIGDATRTAGGVFRLYPNHVKIEAAFLEREADILPRIIWRKTTNAPNKFMGSGVLPAGAYVTLEHEYILIIRKPGKRNFNAPAEKERRRRSAIFWEERNAWFSDLWTLSGARQALAGGAGRDRSAAFPLELAVRLIAMYSLQGDTVLDPFAGTGTTACAALTLGRNSVSADIDPALATAAGANLAAFLPAAMQLGRERLERHEAFDGEHRRAGKEFAYSYRVYGFPVKSGQEQKLMVPVPIAVYPEKKLQFRVEYEVCRAGRASSQDSPSSDRLSSS
jgi:DNA modification methylase